MEDGAPNETYMKEGFLLCLVLPFLLLLSCEEGGSKTYLFAGSYTAGEAAQGIIVFEFNMESGSLHEVHRLDSLVNPSFLSLAPSGEFLYSITESRLEVDGNLSAFRIDTLTGKLSFLNKESVGGRNPVHVSVDQEGKHVVVANYTDAGLSIFECAANGRISPAIKHLEFQGSSIIEGRQDAAHLHSTCFSPDGNYLFAPDLGSDKIRAFDLAKMTTFGEIDTLTVDSKAGSGPRHFTFHPSGNYAYCAEELSGKVAHYAYRDGQLEWLQSYASYEQEHEQYSCADIHVSPDGKFLYVSNRHAENSITIYKIDPGNGALQVLGYEPTHGVLPRSFVIDPTGNYLLVANMSSDNIVVFERNLETGLLRKVGSSTVMERPSSLKMRSYGG